jgi:hypothetical protein
MPGAHNEIKWTVNPLRGLTATYFYRYGQGEMNELVENAATSK